MNSSCCICQAHAKITTSCHSYCTKHYYEGYAPILEDLVKYLATSPFKIVTRFRPIGCYQCNDTAAYISPLILNYIIDTEETDEIKRYLYKLAILFCEFFLSGIETKFETCMSCGKLMINNDPYKICYCDQEFKTNFEHFLEYYIYTQRYVDANIWDQLEDALRRLKGSHVKMLKYTALYDQAETNEFRGRYKDEPKLFVVNENSLWKGDRISLIDNRHAGVVGIYADIKESLTNEIILINPKSFIVAFKINYN